MSVEKRRPPLTTVFLWIVGVLTLVLTGYGIFTGVVLTLPFPYNYLIAINSKARAQRGCYGLTHSAFGL